MRPLNAVGVLNVHAGLAARMLKPSPAMANFLAYHMRRNVREYPTLAQLGAYYPVLQNLDGPVTDEHGAQVCRLLGRALGRAVTYQVTAPMVADMRATYENAMRGIDHIDEQEIPCPAGFAWLDEPWQVGPGLLVRALSWEFTEVYLAPDEGDLSDLSLREVIGPARVQVWPCARIVLWRHDDDTTQAERATRYLGPLVVTHVAMTPLGVRFSKPVNPEDHESSSAFLGLVHLLWIYLGMEITSQRRQGLPSAVRRTARRSLKQAEVRVVILRKVRGVTEPGPGESRERFWSCRWPVQGFSRHRVHPPDGHRAVTAGLDKHCVACGGETSWVTPHIRGPAGLPLKVNDKVLMKLAR